MGVKKKSKGPGILNKHIRENWKENKSATKNLKEMGLSVNPNKLLPVETLKQRLKKSRGDTEESKQLPQSKSQPSAVIQALEIDSKKKPKSKFSINEDTAQFCIYMMELYGEDLKAMSRDKRNFYQHTPGQIRGMIKSFKKADKQYDAYLEVKKELESQVGE